MWALFFIGIVAMGGQRLALGESIAVVEEAITIIGEFWATGERGGVRVTPLTTAPNAAPPPHELGIRVGVYKAGILKLTGRLGDGSLPSLGYLLGGPDDLAAMNKYIDEASPRQDVIPPGCAGC